MKLLIKRLNKDAVLPTKAHKTDTGYDLYSVEDVEVGVGQITLVSTGIAIEPVVDIEEKYLPDIQIRSRSGLAIKHGIFVLNSPGTIDLDYRGEIKVILANFGTEPFIIRKGDRIAQMVISVFINLCNDNIVEVDELSYTLRGENGFRSTGI